jgi:hypothetical protein
VRRRHALAKRVLTGLARQLIPIGLRAVAHAQAADRPPAEHPKGRGPGASRDGSSAMWDGDSARARHLDTAAVRAVEFAARGVAIERKAEFVPSPSR